MDSSCAEITSWPHSSGQPMSLTTNFSIAGLASGLHKAGLNPLHYRSGRSFGAAHPSTAAPTAGASGLAPDLLDGFAWAWRRRPLPRDRAERGDHR